jgi:hypothetical protein
VTTCWSTDRTIVVGAALVGGAVVDATTVVVGATVVAAVVLGVAVVVVEVGPGTVAVVATWAVEE